MPEPSDDLPQCHLTDEQLEEQMNIHNELAPKLAAVIVAATADATTASVMLESVCVGVLGSYGVFGEAAEHYVNEFSRDLKERLREPPADWGPRGEPN